MTMIGRTLTSTSALRGPDAALCELGAALRDAGYHFTTVTPATHERVNRRPDNAWATDLRGVFGWSRPFTDDVLPRQIITLADAAGVRERHGAGWRSLVRFSSYDGELFVHSAFPTDAADAVFLGPDTYRMADAAVAHLGARSGPVRRAVDVGCGTGAGAVAIAKRLPGADVVAVDINPTALRYARVNAALAGTDGVRVCHSDLLDDVEGEIDLIISNPPFMIDPTGRGYRHGGPSGHELPMAVLDAALARLAPGGSLVLFAGTGVVDGRDLLREAAAARLDGTDLVWSYREVDPDVYSEELDGPAYAHAERIAVAVLTATRAC
ncbi:class I SAM-dependent methyltransferase [Asanoa sp. NPDC049518]|uniref:class I SAM-dependent methyltransferase n=1 Tax=unclassified Asanoa TaxID=2685164 RepID=UPI0034394CAD